MKKAIITCFVVLASHTLTHAQPTTQDTIAERMLLLQRANGGWSKSFMGKALDYHQPFGQKEKQIADLERDYEDTTIDNKATTKEISYLLEAYRNTRNLLYKEAAIRGIDYLLAAQYDNGGWPQYYPDDRSYRSQITYNDDAMINVLEVMNAISQGHEYYVVLTETHGSAARRAVRQGVQCILATQVILNGKKTIWAAQYDSVNLNPDTARTYELPSLATAESANILMFLMALEEPANDTKIAIRHGVEWFTKNVINGYATKMVDAPAELTGKDRILVEASDEHVWARFYDLDKQQPLFAGRDGTPRRRLDEIENERRVGYSWYGKWGDKVIRQYEKWRQDH